jgi:hypothetical protein
MKGHIKLRGRTWYAVLSIRDQETGRRKARFVSLPNARGKREAQQECARLINEMRGGYVAPDKAGVAQFLERWLNHMQTQVSPATFERYAEIVHRNLVPALGAFKLAKLRPENISSFYAQALVGGRKDGMGGLSPRTVNHLHRVLKQALKQAVLWGALTINPAAAVKPPRVVPKEMATIDAAETADDRSCTRCRAAHPNLAWRGMRLTPWRSRRPALAFCRSG